MSFYKKAIKLRKECAIKKSCYECEYVLSCFSSNIIKLKLADESIITVAKAIKEEKWDIK